MAATPTLLKVLDEIEDLIAENEELHHRIEQLESQSLHTRGERRPNRKKLTEEEVEFIRDLHRAGATQAEIAWSFDVNPATISRIVRRVYHK